MMTPLSQASIEAAFKSDEELKRATAQIAKDIASNNYDIARLSEVLGFALTSTDVEMRVHGTFLLSQVLTQLPQDFLNATQLEFLANFYADRLKDHHNVIPAVIDGIDALVRMRHLPAECVPKLLQSFFQHTTCQSQLRSDRLKLLGIFKYLSETYEKELKAMSGDFIYGLINSIDGERDPRNLDFIFSFMPDFIATYPLLHLSEEMFEVFACYFPIDFNPSKNDPDTITRDNLAHKLSQCLVASPDFVEWTVTLALEKLESDLVVAKLDSLELLDQAALRFPCDLLEPHFEQIWKALKSEVFPGSDNAEVVGAALRSLRSVLERASAVHDSISHNYQTVVLATILPHLNDVNHRLFNPAMAIALICVASDASFATEKILRSFLLKLKSSAPDIDDEQCTRIYNVIAQIFQIVSSHNVDTLISIDCEECTEIHGHVITTLRRTDELSFNSIEPSTTRTELFSAALNVLNESAPIINERNRAFIYKILVQLLTHDTFNLKETQVLLERLGALQPIELQSNCIDVCIQNFASFSNDVKGKILRNFLPLVHQMAFTQRILDLLFEQMFGDSVSNEARHLTLEATNILFSSADVYFIEELQHNSCLIDKLVNLARSTAGFDVGILAEISTALNQIVQRLSISEQYMLATQYLPVLNLQLTSDLFVAKGLLGFIHKDISLDEHFEGLLENLTHLSLSSENEQMREVAHHLLCSLVNKVDYNDHNGGVIKQIIDKLIIAVHKENGKAVETLAWLAKGLVVRGREEAGDIIEAIATLLDHPLLSTAASLAFEIMSVEYPQLHLPVVKFLFKQKFFHLALSKLSQKLELYCEHHLNAFIYVLKSTPHPILKMNIEKIGPILFNALDAKKVHILCIALEICKNFVKNQDEYFRSHLNHIIPSCLQLSKFTNSMQVRIEALNVLHDITKYPAFALLPFRTDVVLDLAETLDDPKRLVRSAAVRTRNAWFLVGAPNTE